MPHAKRTRLLKIYFLLFKRFGHRGWWPGETPFEVMAGAILTQNTNWANVEKAIAELKKRKLLSPIALSSVPNAAVEKAIRSSGYYRQKAERLKGFSRFLCGRYGCDLQKMFSRPAGALRGELLSVKGIGPETADSILLYAAGKPVFVVDAYTKRVFSRAGMIRGDEGYDDVRAFFEKNLPHDSALFNDYHAQIVELGKRFCLKSEPVCWACPILAECRFGRKRVY